MKLAFLIAIFLMFTCFSCVIANLECYVCRLRRWGCRFPRLKKCTDSDVLPALLMIYDMAFVEKNVSKMLESKHEYKCLDFGASAKKRFKSCMYKEVDFCSVHKMEDCHVCYHNGCNRGVKPRGKLKLRRSFLLLILWVLLLH